MGKRRKPADVPTHVQPDGEAAAVYVPLSALTGWEKNPRDNDAAVGPVADSIRAFGFGAPIVAQAGTGIVIAGHTRLRAAEAVGLDRVPVRFVELSERDSHLLALADNKLGELASWDEVALGQALSAFSLEEAAVAGFDQAELDKLGASLLEGDPKSADGVTEDQAPAPPDVAVTQPGDLYVLGDHLLLCGDSTSRDDVARLLDGELADMCFTDPPYGVAVSGAGGQAITGDLGNVAISGFFPIACEVVKRGRAIYMCGGAANVPLYHKLYEIHCRQVPKIIVWDKGAFVLRHYDYHAQYELIFYGWTPTPEGVGPEGRWFGDRKQADVWTVKRDASSEYVHPTQKPVGIPARAIVNSSPVGGTVFEPFGGSGSTLIACEQLGRKCRAIEIDPRYCDAIVARWETLTGKSATRIRHGKETGDHHVS